MSATNDLVLPALAVLVVDDQAAVRDGVARLIACAPLTLRQVCTAATAEHALRLAAWLQPDLVVLDVDLAGGDGLALIAQLAPATVLVLSCHSDVGTRERAQRLGAGAFIEKHQPAAELLGALVQLAHLHLRGEQRPAPPGAASQVLAGASSDVLKAAGS
ncbi:MAG: response regulator transcription factor [Pseudomonadota bacterium]